MRYQATAGQRLFSESHTSDQPSELAFSTFSIPLYSTYSTYVIRVTAVLDDGRIIISRDLAISENKLNNRQTGQNGKWIIHTTYVSFELSHDCVFLSF